MPMINFSDPISLLIATGLFVLVLWFSKHSKKSVITALMLFIFLTILSGHAIQLALGGEAEVANNDIMHSIIFDLVFVLVSFITYLWIDDIEANEKNKKSIDGGLKGFWKKV